jgi:hypothetical protein
MLIPLHSVSVSLEGPQPAPVTSVPYSSQLHENELGSSVTALGSQHDADLQFWEVPSKKSRCLGTALGSRYPLDPGEISRLFQEHEQEHDILANTQPYHFGQSAQCPGASADGPGSISQTTLVR